MKKRGHRDIPDFSRAPKGPPRPDKATEDKTRTAPPVTTRTVKPHSTSQKSGRRGS